MPIKSIHPPWKHVHLTLLTLMNKKKLSLFKIIKNIKQNKSDGIIIAPFKSVFSRCTLVRITALSLCIGLCTSGHWCFSLFFFSKLLKLCHVALGLWMRRPYQVQPQILSWTEGWALTQPPENINNVFFKPCVLLWLYAFSLGYSLMATILSIGRIRR